MTLGAILMLGGVSNGQGQELSGAVGPAPAGPSFPSFDAPVLPTLPENWSDLPVRLTAPQSVAYNSNIFGVPVNFALPAGDQRGDFVSTTQFGISTKPYWLWSGQQFFFDASFGEIRYLHQVDFNSDIYNVDAGVNWTMTSRCSGALTALASKSPTTVTTQVVTATQVGVGANYSTTTSFNETGKCAFGNGYSAIFNSGETQSTSSNPVDALNNSRATMLAAGIEYTNSLSDLTALATITDTDFSDRPAALGLTSTFVEHDVSLTYVRQIDPNLTLTEQIGLTGAGSEFTLALPRTLLPHYSATIKWVITPKLSLTASAAKTIAPPTTLVSNSQLSYTTQFNLSYQATPKITIAAGASAGYTSAVFSSGLAGTIFAGLQGTQDFYSAQGSLTYTMTPFLVATLTASYNETVQNHLITPEDLITVSLNYKPY